MLYTVILTTNARLDIQEAIEWENKRSAGLGKRFFKDLEQQLTVISNSPYIVNIRYRNVRCAVPSVFQYLIHYTIDDINKQVIILRVLHTSRKPDW